MKYSGTDGRRHGTTLGTAVMLLISLGSWRSPFLVNVTAQERVRVADLNDHLIDPFDEARAGKAVVFLFVSVDCPISNRYAPEARRLEERFAPEGVAFWLVYPNASETPAAIRRHIERLWLSRTRTA